MSALRKPGEYRLPRGRVLPADRDRGRDAGRDRPAGGLQPGPRRPPVQQRGHREGERHGLRPGQPVWTSDLRVAMRAMQALNFGHVLVNDHLMVTSEMPHGGIQAVGLRQGHVDVLVRGVHQGEARDDQLTGEAEALALHDLRRQAGGCRAASSVILTEPPALLRAKIIQARAERLQPPASGDRDLGPRAPRTGSASSPSRRAADVPCHGVTLPPPTPRVRLDARNT